MSGLVASIPAAVAALPPEVLNPPAERRAAAGMAPGADHATLHALLALQGVMGVADGVTTEMALGRGAEEVNPLLQGSGLKRNLVKGALNGLVGFAAEKLHDQHPKLAKGLTLLASGTQGYGAIHNLRNMRR